MKHTDDPLADVEFSDAKPPAELGKRIVVECTRDLSPARGLTLATRWALTLLTASLAWATLFAFHFDLLFASPRSLAVVLGSGFGILVASAFVLLKPPGRRPSLSARIAVVALALGSFLVFLGSLVDNAVSLSSALETRGTYSCALYSVVTGGVSVLLLMLPWRRTDPFSPNLTGAFLGLAGGIAAGLAATMLCPNHEAWHLYLGHGLALGATVAAAAWLGRRWLSP